MKQQTTPHVEIEVTNPLKDKDQEILTVATKARDQDEEQRDQLVVKPPLARKELCMEDANDNDEDESYGSEIFWGRAC